MTPISADDLTPDEPEATKRPGRGTHLPYLPDRNASMSVMRQFASRGIGLPAAVRVDGVTRYGRKEEDAMVIHLSNEGEVRVDHQKRLLSPGSLQALLASESDGLCRPAYLTKAECGDVYMALCILATTEVGEDELSELSERVQFFVHMCEPLHASLVQQARYDTLRRVRRRTEYDRKAAQEGKQGKHGPRPVLVVDHLWGTEGATYLIRHSEVITYLRVVHMQQIADNFLKGRMTEIGCHYHNLQAHGPGRRHHVSLAFYQLPDDMAVPHVETEDD